jgi:hypothetical protein
MVKSKQCAWRGRIIRISKSFATTMTINCAWRGGIIRNPPRGTPSERDTVDKPTLKKQRLRVCTVN